MWDDEYRQVLLPRPPVHRRFLASAAVAEQRRAPTYVPVSVGVHLGQLLPCVLAPVSVRACVCVRVCGVAYLRLPIALRGVSDPLFGA